MFPSRPSKTHTLSLANEAIADASKLSSLFNFIYKGSDPTRWRAAWIIEKVALKQPTLLIDERDNFIHLAMRPNTPNRLLRLLLTTLHHLPDAEELNIAFFNFLLDRMIDLQSPPSVQSIAMKLAARQSHYDSSLHSEFLSIINNLELSYYPAATRSVVKRYI